MKRTIPLKQGEKIDFKKALLRGWTREGDEGRENPETFHILVEEVPNYFGG